MPKTIVIDARIICTTTGRYVERLLHYLEQIDTVNLYKIVVLKKDIAFYQPTNPNFSIVEGDFPWYSFAEQRGLRTLLYSLKPDLIHFTMPHQPVGMRLPHITTVHDLTLLKTYNSDKNFFIFKAKQLVGRFVFKAIGRDSAHIICPTQFVKDEYVAYANIPEDKVTVTYEGADTTSVAAEPMALLDGKQFIMYVGQQSDYKNIRRLIVAHQQLRSQHPELLLVLAGKLTKAHRMTQAWVEKHAYQGVIFTDFVSDGELRWLYEHCRAYVFASLMEGFGLPGLEAMCAGAPVASSNATCLPEVYGNAALYFDPYNPEDMANTINDVISNETLRTELIARGYEQVKKYSWRHMAQQTHAIYQRVLAD